MKNLTIGIDGNEANVKNRVGIGEYAFELLREFYELQITNYEFTVYLKEKPNDDMPKENNNWNYKIFGPSFLWTQLALPLRLFIEKNKPNIFFSPSHYAPRVSPVPTAIAIMDLAFLRYPDMFNKKDLYQLREWTLYSAKNASLIFTISQSSKDDIIKFYNIKPEKIVVTYPGIRQGIKVMNKLDFKEILNKYKISPNFILFVGTLQPRKNIAKLIKAFSQIKDKKDLNLVIVGKKGWQYEEILSAPEKFGISDMVKFLDFVPDEELDILYKNAICYCLPSLYEGFGLPVLEAMQRGCPVITSSISSLPEAGGDAALYCDPKNAVDIKDKLEMIIGNKKLRLEMIEKGYKQVKKFSWEKTAKETLAALEGLVNK